MTATAGNEDTVTGEVTPTAEEAEQATEEQTLPPMEDQAWYDAALGILHGKAVELTNAVNAEVDWLKENSSDLLTVIEAVEGDENDEKVKAAQAKIESLKDELLKVEGALRSYATDKAKARIAESQDSEAVKEHEAQYAAARVALRDYVKTFRSNYKDPEDDSKSLVDAYLPKAKSLGRQSAGGSGKGGKRLRNFKMWTVDGRNVGRKIDGEFKSTASDAAKDMSVDLKLVQEAYWTAAGTREPKDYPSFLQFDVTTPEGKTHRVTAERDTQ